MFQSQRGAMPTWYITRWRMILAHAVILFVFTGQAFSVLFDVELWPFGLGLYLIGAMRSVSMNHIDAVLILVLGIMAVARCGNACSLDRWLIGRTRLQASRPSGDYRWPVQLIQIATILPLFVAGISKLRHAGLEWVFSDTLAIVLLQNHFRTDPLLPWGVELARYGWLCQLLAAGELITELALPLALVSVRARLVLIPGALGLLLGFRLLLGPNFAP